MRVLSDSTETTVRLGALHLIPVVIGAGLLVWLMTSGFEGREWMAVPAVFLVGEGMYCFGLANGVDMARGSLPDDGE